MVFLCQVKYNNIGNKKYTKNTDWLILEIDTKDIDVLYTDPNSINGYYFLGNIRPENIKKVKEQSTI